MSPTPGQQNTPLPPPTGALSASPASAITPTRGAGFISAYWKIACRATVLIAAVVYYWIGAPQAVGHLLWWMGMAGAMALFFIPLFDRHYWFQRLLIRLALGFLTVFVVIPAGNVFAEATSNGWAAYKGVFFPPPANQARLDVIRAKIEDPDTGRVEKKKLRQEEQELESAPKNWASVRLTLGIAAIVVPLNMLFGLAAAWSVTKFRFKGRSLLVSVIDLPFSVSPVIAGLIFVLLFGAPGFLAAWSKSDRLIGAIPAFRAAGWFLLALPILWIVWKILTWIGRGIRKPGRRAEEGVAHTSLLSRWIWRSLLLVTAIGLLIWKYSTEPSWSWAFLMPTEWRWPDLSTLYWRGFSAERWWPVAAAHWNEGVIFTPLAIVMASIFVTFPFVARSLIPLMEVQGVEAEQAALTLGASGWYTFRRVTLPGIKWALLYGAILCSARALGEFGAVSVVANDLDSNTTMPLRIEKLWQATRTQAAFTVASLLAMLAVVTLILKGIVELKTAKERE